MHDATAARFTGAIPDYYERALGPVIFTDYAADLARRAAASSPERVLETAAGTGIVTRQLRDLLPAGSRLTATDLNEAMLDIARAKFRPGEEVTFMPADATELPFAEGAFDAVVCQYGVMFFPDKARSHREVRRVLARNGRYVFNVWDSHAHNAFGRLAYETAARFYPDDPPQFFQVPFCYHSIDAIKVSLIDAGFTDIKASVVRLAKQVADPALFARGLIFGTPLIEQIRTRAGADPERLIEALTDAFIRELRLGECPLHMQAIVFEAA
jgi:SAM-dependent methyltransferase